MSLLKVNKICFPFLPGLNFSCDIKESERIYLSGQSGSGKTTILRSFIGFQKVTEGSIVVFGKKLSGYTIHEIRKNTAYLSQTPFTGLSSLMEDIQDILMLKANQNLMISRKQILDTMNLLGIKENQLSQSSRELSGGERQRAALGIILILNRKLILLDEPVSALDPLSRDLVLDRLFKDRKHTLILTSHDASLRSYCDREISL